MMQRYFLHLGGGRHLKIQGHCKDFHQPSDICIRDMAAILTQMRRNTISPSFLGDTCRAQWVRRIATSRISYSCDVVDIHAKSELAKCSHIIPHILESTCSNRDTIGIEC
jgi:hypothetical protein